MAFWGMESGWADDGVDSDLLDVEAGGVDVPPQEAVATGAPLELSGDSIAEDEDVLFDDSWADEGFVRAPSSAAPLLEEGISGEAVGAREALELLQLLAAPPPAAPSARAPAGRPTGRTGTHSTLVDLGGVGGVDYGGAAPMLGSSIPPRIAFFH